MTYVISDLHGYETEKLEALLDGAGFGSADSLYVLGDVIDRGEHGVELLKWMMRRPNVHFILGNHEDMMLKCEFLFWEITQESIGKLDARQINAYMRWSSNGNEPTAAAMRKESHASVEAILDYLRKSPLYALVEARGRRFVLVHGGLGNFSPEKQLCEYSESELLWERPKLEDRYYDDRVVIFGHTPTAIYGSEHRGKIIVTDTWIDIDTGVSCGLAPTLLRLDDMAVLSGEAP